MPKSVKQVSKHFHGSCLCGGRQMTDVGLREEAKESAKGRNFTRFRLRTTFGCSEHSFSLRSFEAVGAGQVPVTYEESSQTGKASIFTLNGGEGKNRRYKRCVIALVIVWILDFFSGIKSHRDNQLSHIRLVDCKGVKEISGSLNPILTWPMSHW